MSTTFKPGEEVRVKRSDALPGTVGHRGVVCDPIPEDADFEDRVPVRTPAGEFYFAPSELERIKG